MSTELKKKLGIKEDKPTDWFETLYATSDKEGTGVPWANMSTHPMLKDWLTTNSLNGKKKTALVVGCGMGDDAIELETLGFEVTAFDVSHNAIELCKERFPSSKVKFVQADLLKDIKKWHHKFDFVLEIFTIQALPPKYENTLIENISNFVSNNGKLVVITEIQQGKRTYENGPPWLLNTEYIKAFNSCGLEQTYQNKSTKTERGKEIHLSIFQPKHT